MDSSKSATIFNFNVGFAITLGITTISAMVYIIVLVRKKIQTLKTAYSRIKEESCEINEPITIQIESRSSANSDPTLNENGNIDNHEGISVNRSIGEIQSSYQHFSLGGGSLFSTVSSGAGEPFLKQSTVSKEVIKNILIGHGRYGNVWKGTYIGQYVAIKLVNDFESGIHEAAIYINNRLVHECFVMFDINPGIVSREPMLIFEYHSKGSLCDFLKTFGRPKGWEDVDWDLLIKILHSITSGLSYLHKDFTGHLMRKHRIAHRDIKTKNYLVKDDGRCCLGDFGLAVSEEDLTAYNSGDPTSNQEQNESPNYFAQLEEKKLKTSKTINEKRSAGTPLYMAPEILSIHVNKKASKKTVGFEEFLRADVYSFGYVFWEIFPKDKDEISSHQFPLSHLLGKSASAEEILEIVSKPDGRPRIPKEWEKNSVYNELTSLVKVIWNENPSSRPRMLFIKETLNGIFGCS